MGCGTTLVKYITFFLNFLFVLGGIALIVVGALILSQVTEVSDFVESRFSAPPIALIVIGAIVFIIAFYGCCGAIRESNCMLLTYAIFLLVLLIAEVVIAVLAFVYHNDTENALLTALQNAYYNYDNDREPVDAVQRALKCCGFVSYSASFTPPYPASCCGRGNNEDLCTLSEIYTKGCGQALVDFINDSGLILGGVAIGIAVVLVVGIIFGCCLANHFKRK